MAGTKIDKTYYNSNSDHRPNIDVDSREITEEQRRMAYEERFSIKRILPPYLVKRIEAVEADLPLYEAFLHGEHRLRKFVMTKRRYLFNGLDNRLRHVFWSEYDRVLDTGLKFNDQAFCTFGCNKVQWYAISSVPERMAFIICPIMKVQVQLEGLLDQAISRLDDIVNLPLYDDKGRIDKTAASLVMKALVMLDVKVNGPSVQKHLHQVQSVNVNLSESEYKKKIKEMESILGKDAIEEAVLKERAKIEQDMERPFFSNDGALNNDLAKYIPSYIPIKEKE